MVVWLHVCDKKCLGTFLGILRAIMEGFYYVYQMKIFYNDSNHPLKKKPWTVICLSSIYSLLGYSCMFFSYSWGNNFTFAIDKGIILPAVYSGVLNVAVGYGLLNMCIKYSNAIISSCMFSMNIATALLFLNRFAGEKLTTAQYVLSVPLILSGLVVILSPMFGPKEVIVKDKELVVTNKEETET